MKGDFAAMDEISRIRQMLDSRINDIRVSVHETLVMQGSASPFINQSKAYKVFGRKNITNWESWGLIKGIKDGEGNGQVRYDLSRLILIAGTPNRTEYFKNKKL